MAYFLAGLIFGYITAECVRNPALMSTALPPIWISLGIGLACLLIIIGTLRSEIAKAILQRMNRADDEHKAQRNRIDESIRRGARFTSGKII